MTKRLAAALFCFIACAGAWRPAQAFVDGGLKQTFGTENYKGTYGFLDLGGDFHIKPYFNLYNSDISSGTYKTFAARLAYDKKMWGVGLTVGGSPVENGYSNRFFGIDGAISLIPGMGPVTRIGSGENSPGDSKASGTGLARIDLFGGITGTNHTDQFQRTLGGINKRTGAVNIHETDVNVGAGASFMYTGVSAGITKSSYDKDLNKISARAGPIAQLSGLNSTIQGFPNVSLNARIDWSLFPILTPFLSYNYTTFEISEPAAHALTFGVSAELQMLEANVSYEHYYQNPSGGGVGNQNYFSLGATLRF